MQLCGMWLTSLYKGRRTANANLSTNDILILNQIIPFLFAVHSVVDGDNFFFKGRSHLLNDLRVN